MSPAPGISNKLVAVIYNTITPAAEVARQVFNPPHSAPRSVSFPNVPIGTYIVKVHQSTDGIVLGNIEQDFWVNASISNVTAYTIKTFQVGLGRSAPYYDPSDGDVDYVNPDLDGLDYIVFKSGYGPLDWANDINPFAGGGFSFINGQVFSQDEVYTILINNLTQTVAGGSTQSFPIGVIATINTNFTFNSTHYNKILEIVSVNNLVITMPNLATIPDGTQFAVNTHILVDDSYTAPFRYAVLQMAVGESCLIYNNALGTVHIGRGEEVTFIKFGTILRVMNGADGYRDLGRYVYYSSKPPKSSLHLSGGWYDKVIFGRIFNEYINRLDPGEVVIGVDDSIPSAENRVKWIIGTNKFWVPDHGGLFHRPSDVSSVIDPIRYPNTYQADDNKAHNHVTAPYNRSIARASEAGGNQIPQVDGSNSNANQKYRVAGMDDTRWGDATIISQGSESRPKNVTVNAYVLI